MPLCKIRYLFYFQQNKSLSNKKKSFGQFKGEYKIIFQQVTKSDLEQQFKVQSFPQGTSDFYKSCLVQTTSQIPGNTGHV